MAMSKTGQPARPAARPERGLERFLDATPGFLDTLPIGVYVCDRDGKLVRFNRRATELWGRTPEVGTERFCGTYKAFHADGRPLDLAEGAMPEVLKTGQPAQNREVVLERPDGSRIIIVANIEPIFDDRGEVVGAINCFQDITSLRAAEQGLRERDQRLAATYEHATIGIAEIDAEGRRLRVNESACAIAGRSREEMLATNVFDQARRDEVDVDRKELARLASGETDRYTIEKRYPRPDGVELWLSIMCSAVRDDAGKFLYAVRVFQDITEQKRAEEALRASELRFRQLLEALPAAVYTTDAAGRITFFNQAAAELWGVRPELGSAEWCGSWKIYWPDGTYLPHDQCPMAIALKENRPIRGVEAVAERPDGTRVPFMPFPTPLRDEAGNLVGAVNMLVDISERKDADSRQKALLDELNHRVKNTLATVQSLAAQTVRGTKVPRAVRDNFEARLVALSRAHDQLTRGRWESANLKEIAEEIFAPYRSSGGGLMIDGEGVYLAPQAALMLAMIFHELATNAAKYGSLSAPDGRLALSWKIATGADSPRLRIEWQESGGPQVSEPARRGFGSKLVERGITQELKGSAEMTFDPAGLRCTMEIPLGA
jgi:PAS domain S-box-containing protein